MRYTPVMSSAPLPETRLDDALEQLAREGGPVPVSRGGRTVAVLITPAELATLEDAHDARALRDAIARGRTGEAVSLEAMAEDLGLDLSGPS